MIYDVLILFTCTHSVFSVCVYPCFVQVGIFELCPDITYAHAASTDSDEIEEQIGTGECLSRKSAILNCISLSAMVLLLAFSHYQEISERAQKR